jgi:energy-converting hydrogenase Eha subunit G
MIVHDPVTGADSSSARLHASSLFMDCPPGQFWSVIWAALILLVSLACAGAGAWYVARRDLAATNESQRLRLLRQAVSISSGVGVAILVAGVVAFVITGYDWLVLLLLWALGLLHLGLLGRSVRRARKQAGRA